ncbi:hypothetical protein [Kutzneria sp. CA-103260]|uniref:hypothetical protein n=1 Tax=Kutzneria sp. CA-103260 TaxID=2802641 RepID=UPI001BA985A0|nr:hypothetical protein [Kutzneria sp. CA-103260]QUQ65203.1 hypothetical protein JJ691_29240 [Kutzneria sp. CA-103260]
MEEKLARLIECEGTIRRCQAELIRLIADLNIDKHAAVDIALALQLSHTNAAYLAEWASHVVKVFPNVVEAMEAGVISEWSAHGLVDPTDGYSEELA